MQSMTDGLTQSTDNCAVNTCGLRSLECTSYRVKVNNSASRPVAYLHELNGPVGRSVGRLILVVRMNYRPIIDLQRS